MASKAMFGGNHTAGIFSDMTVDGPTIGTLVAIIDRAKNLPNRRTMGKQDPYCAARLGKEAKKTTTDKRGGQTPRWDQEMRFTVHDSPDYHQLKVSVFNDDKKTELIGETWVSLDGVLTQGGGQSDSWHGLNCKGKYAGEIRIELTFYDTRPKAEKPVVERRRESTRPDGPSPAVGGPRDREHTPVKRRPLPSDPTAASPSPVNTPEHRGLSSQQSGPRPMQPRQAEHTPTHQRRSHHHDSQPQRRPVPDASPLAGGAPMSSHNTPQHRIAPTAQQPASSSNTPQYSQEAFDMSYTAPKPYEVQPIEPAPQHPQSFENRPSSHHDLRSSRGFSRSQVELPHSHSAPIVPTQHAYEPVYEPTYENTYEPEPSPPAGQFSNSYSERSPLHEQRYIEDSMQMQTTRQDPSFQVQPLRTSRSHDLSSSYDLQQPSNDYDDHHNTYDPYSGHGRSLNMMQPTVQDEDEVPPPPPVHRSNAATVPQPASPPAYHNDAPAPLNINRYREEAPQQTYESQQSYESYDPPAQPYEANEYALVPHSERRYTHPRPVAQPVSRPVSRDAMVPSPLRQETSALPSSLVPGYDSTRDDSQALVWTGNSESRAYQQQQLPAYETPPRLRQYSEPDYRTPPQYETPSRPQGLEHHHSMASTDALEYYPHPPPQEPRHTSPVHDPPPLIKPRAVSPGDTRGYADSRTSRAPARSMPTRKSVSPRPPPTTTDSGERRLSGVPFNPDSFDILNPAAAKTSPAPNSSGGVNRRGSNIDINEKGQVVTFSGRVIDASDHLPLDSWAPEPEPKGPQKERPSRDRPTLNGARDIEGAMMRERDYRRDRVERERIRNAVNDAAASETPAISNALTTYRGHSYSNSNSNNHTPTHSNALVLSDHSSTPPGSGGRNRLQKRSPRPVSNYGPMDSSPSNIPMPSSHVLRERENPRGYGSSPNYGGGNRHSIAAPPIPAKIPLDGGMQNEDMSALSLELQSIDIGPGSGGRSRGNAARPRYAGY